MIRDANGIVHQAGCEWLCGWHDPEQYFCGCASPKPSKSRGARNLCADCGAQIPDDSPALRGRVASRA